MKKVELLSPVGNKEMLYQAIHNGADAVYLAGINYGARKFSTNFNNEELISAIKYSHLYGVSVYVTVNTLIYEEEIPDFLKYIEFLYLNDVDALIMQDIGMISLVKKNFKDLSIHASVQCHNHNKETLLFLKELGCSRVVMARELSLKEITAMNVDIEKEIFVYGALCVCYSGCCLFSSLNGGRSGNRGECVGSCRLKYDLMKNDEVIALSRKYLLSTKDLNTLFNLKDILDAGIDSLKIEGRMKSPAYVGYVTRIFRKLIDKYYRYEKLELTQDEVLNLKKIYNREFTKGYLFDDVSIMNTKTPNHQGIPIGKVVKCDKKKIMISLTENISMTDGIRFKNSNIGMIVNKLYDDKNNLVKEVISGRTCILDNKIGLKTKDVVLKTLDSRLMKEIDDINYKKINVTFTGTFKVGEKFKISINDGINEIEKYGTVPEFAKTREVTQDKIISCINKLGNTPFISKKINIVKDDNIFVNLKDINIVRRELVEELIKKREIIYNRHIIDDLSFYSNCGEFALNSSNFKLNVLVRTEEQLLCCLDNKINDIYVADYNLYKKYANLDNVYLRLKRVKDNYRENYSQNLLLSELGAVYKYQHSSKNLVSDYYLNVTNTESVSVLLNNNVKRVTLSCEIDDENIAKISRKFSSKIELIIYGRLELMLMKYCPLKENIGNCRSCNEGKTKFYLRDRLHNKYPIVTDNCVTHIMHFKNIDHIHKINFYRHSGINNFRLELYDENYQEVSKLIKKVKLTVK